MNNNCDNVYDDELMKDVENIMRTGSVMEKLDTLEFVSRCFNKEVRMTKILVEAAKDSENSVVSEKAKELFIKNMDKFISKFISEQYPTFIESHYEDMIQAARMGIIIGLEKYDPEISKPTTFFVLYIRHEISQYINNYVNGLSTYYANEKYKINKAISLLENDNREPNDINISEITGIGIDKVKQLRSLITTSNSVAYDEILLNKADEKDTPEQIILKKELGDMINDSIKKYLNKIEQKIIIMYYGLTGIEDITNKEIPLTTKKAFKDISEALNIPYVKVRKYHASALRKLHTVVSKSNMIMEESKSEKVLNAEMIPLVSEEQGSAYLQKIAPTKN